MGIQFGSAANMPVRRVEPGVRRSDEASQLFECSSQESCSAYFSNLSERILALSRNGNASLNRPDLRRRYDLFMAMQNGTLHVEYPTGMEGCVKNQMMTRADYSVDLLNLFDLAYECSGKDPFLALHTTYDILEEGCFLENRDHLPLQKKMMPLRSSDSFGLRYHFFGGALLSILAGNALGSFLWGSYHLTQRQRARSDGVKMSVDDIGHGLGSALMVE